MDTQVLDRLEKWFRKGEYGRVVYSCDRLLQDPQYAHLRSDILLWKGFAHEFAGPAWHGEAMSCYREGIAAAGRNHAIKARLMAALGKLYAASGDHTSYEQMMKEFGRITRDHQPEVMRWGTFVWFNFGVALDNAFRWHDAGQAYVKAAVLAEQFELTTLLGRCLHNLGGVQLSLGQLAEAQATMLRAESLIDDETAGHKKHSRKAEYYLAADDLVNAQQMITAALTHPRVDDMTRADVYYTWARTLEALKRPTEAYEKALLALDCAVRAAHYPGVHKVNQFLQASKPVD